MITLVSTPALKAIKGLQMQTPNPPLGLAYLAGTLRANGYPYKVIDGLGLGLEQIRIFEPQPNFRIQGLED